MHLHLFNPDTDLALANGDGNYTPPASVRKMAEDLALLPAWYASPGTYSMASGEVSCIHPWGWNPALVKQLGQCGLPPALLPSPAQLERIRELAHRSVALSLCRELRGESDDYCGAAVQLFSFEEVRAFFDAHPFCILKAPISGSGRGLFMCKNEFNYFAERWTHNALKRQQSVVAEPLFDRVADFAMLFHADGRGGVDFSGYSLFKTDEKGLYKGNYLLTNQQIEERLSQYVPLHRLRALIPQLSARLSRLLGTAYRGFLGIDMMVCRFTEPPFYRLHPCVEINLRMTMGMVARRIRDNHIAEGSHGRFVIDYYADPRQLHTGHRLRQKRYPLQRTNGKIASGYTPLVPIRRDTKYVAYVVVDEDAV